MIPPYTPPIIKEITLDIDVEIVLLSLFTSFPSSPASAIAGTFSPSTDALILAQAVIVLGSALRRGGGVRICPAKCTLVGRLDVVKVRAWECGSLPERPPTAASTASALAAANAVLLLAARRVGILTLVVLCLAGVRAGVGD